MEVNELLNIKKQELVYTITSTLLDDVLELNAVFDPVTTFCNRDII